MSSRVFILIAFSVGFSASCFAQWDEIAYSESLASGHNDLHFNSNDTGFVVGGQYLNQELAGYVLKTTNGGASWDTTFVENKVFRAIYFPSNDTGYIAFVENNRLGILRSSDSGLSWVNVADSIALTNPVSLQLTFFDNARGVLAVQGAAFLTNDYGETWGLIENHPVGNSGTIDSYGSYYASTGGISFVYSDDACESFSSSILTDNSS